MLNLSASPANLLLVLLTLNALFLPYHGRFHDAVLYEAQVSNRVENGRFTDDLFFRHGSQDSYSLFSRAVAPLAGTLGVPATFFLLYLLSSALFFWSLIRLVQRLISDRQISTLGLLALAVCTLPVGGLNIFHVNETFFTPRLLASALVLLGLDCMLAGWLLLALPLLLTGLLMHPLIGFGGLLLFLFWCLFRYVPRRCRVPLVGVVGTVALTVLLIPPLGLRLFGYMDPVWREQVCSGLPCLLSSEWHVRDWANVLLSVGITFAGWYLLSGDRLASDFLLALVAVGLAGIVGSVLVCYLPYALLLQGQPFRVLWLAQVLHIPLAILLAKHWWACGGLGRFAAILLLGYLGGEALNGAEVLFCLSLFLCLAYFLSLAPQPWKANWAWLSLVGSLAGIFAIQTVSSWFIVVNGWQAWKSLVGIDCCLRVLSQALAPSFRVLLGLAILLAIGRSVGFGFTFRIGALSTLLGVQLVAGFVAQLPSVRDLLEPYHKDARFVRQIILERWQARAGSPTVYWPTSFRTQNLWFDVGTNSYFSVTQLAGNVFSRDTALEGRRRANLVVPFELDCVRENRAVLPGWYLSQMERLCQTNLDMVLPRENDLLKLSADETLDFIVARQGFPGLYVATNGSWFIYDCRELRSRQDGSSIHPSISRRGNQGETP